MRKSRVQSSAILSVLIRKGKRLEKHTGLFNQSHSRVSTAAKSMPFICSRDPRAEQSWWKGQARLAWHCPEPAQHLSSAQCHQGCTLPWVFPQDLVPKDCPVLCFTFHPLASPQLENLAEDLFLLWDWWGGEGADGSVCRSDPGSVKILLIIDFSALSDQCTPKGRRVSLCLGLSLLKSLVGAKSVWGWMWSVLNDLEVESSVRMTRWLQLGSHSHWAFLCMCETGWGESLQENSSRWEALSKSKGWLEGGWATFSALALCPVEGDKICCTSALPK